MNELTKRSIGSISIRDSDSIGLTVIKNKMWNNKLAEFQRGDLPVGSTVEEIFVDLKHFSKHFI